MNREGKFKLIREMIGSESIVGAFKNLVESTVCSEKFKIKPADTSDEAKYYSDLIWGMLNDLEKPLVEYIKDWTSSADCGFCLSAELACQPDSAAGDSGLADWHVCRHVCAGIFHQPADAVWHGAGDRHRGG